MASNPPERNAAPFPDRIGRYELLLPIGSGGMAAVFLARASGMGGFERDVAVKIIHAHLRADEESKLHLLDEARLAARIRHPNVVPVTEVDDNPFGVYLVMDYVEGDSLAGLMRAAKAEKFRIPLPIVARILSDTLSGLHAAHGLCGDDGHPLNLVHRDFTPQNILIGVDGISRLSDFSVAKAADRAVRTRTGLVKGKIAYMSPEQARGHAVDRRCDVWAAGVVAWELIAWRRLHKEIDAVSTLLSVVTEAPPRLKQVVPEVPDVLDDVVARALEMDVEQRIPSALALRRDLDEAFRSVCGIADPQEVGDLMVRLFGEKLAERRERATEVRRLRLRMGEIARPADPHGEDSPLDPVSSRSNHPLREQPAEVTQPDRPAVRALPGIPAADGDATEAGLVSAQAPAFRPRRRRSLVALVAAAVAGVLGFVSWRFTLDDHSRSEPQADARSAARPSVAFTAKLDPAPSARAPALESADAAFSKPVSSNTQPASASSLARSTPAKRVAVPTSHRAISASAAPAGRAQPASQPPSKLAADPYVQKP